VNVPGQGFEADDNALTLYWEGGECELPRAAKAQLARTLIAQIAAHYSARQDHHSNRAMHRHADDSA
jgi:phosphopantothenoylcysteine decarboxylase/phosphopantothenate--cysteine ligase